MVVAKAAMAPTIIMPSTPRLRTPAFSTTSSPTAAKTSGVAATMTPIRMFTRRSMAFPLLRRLRLGGGRGCPDAGAAGPFEAVIHQHVGGKQEEQQHALKHA